MAKDIVLKGRQVRLKLPNNLKGFLMRAQVDEGLSQITETVVEFMSSDIDLDLQKVVGERLRLEIIRERERQELELLVPAADTGDASTRERHRSHRFAGDRPA